MKKQTIKKLYDNFANLINYICAFLMAAMFILVFTNVVLRYVFHTGFAWTHEAAQFAFVFVCLFGIVAATRDNGHFTVTFLVDAVPPAAKRVLLLIKNIFILICTVVLIIGSYKISIVTAGTISPALGVPNNIKYWICFVSSILVLLYAAVNTVFDLIRPLTKEKEDTADDNSEKGGDLT